MIGCTNVQIMPIKKQIKETIEQFSVRVVKIECDRLRRNSLTFIGPVNVTYTLLAVFCVFVRTFMFG